MSIARDLQQPDAAAPSFVLRAAGMKGAKGAHAAALFASAVGLAGTAAAAAAAVHGAIPLASGLWDPAC